jgi:hypothetical protein
LFGLLGEGYKKFSFFEIRKILLTSCVTGIGWGFAGAPIFYFTVEFFLQPKEK